MHYPDVIIGPVQKPQRHDRDPYSCKVAIKVNQCYYVEAEWKFHEATSMTEASQMREARAKQERDRHRTVKYEGKPSDVSWWAKQQVKAEPGATKPARHEPRLRMEGRAQ